MSATNRGSKRIEADCYPTPLTAFTPLLPYLSLGKPMWEPACGDGRLIKAMADYGLQASGGDIETGYDFLQDFDPALGRMCIVTNPPFSLAFEFCQHAVKHAPEVFLLLRLNFLASKKRREWFKANEPRALFVLAERPSFAKGLRCKKCEWRKIIPAEAPTPGSCPECGGKIKVTASDNCEYGWYDWGQRHTGIFHI